MTAKVKLEKGMRLRDKITGELFEINIVTNDYVYYDGETAEGQVSLMGFDKEFEVIEDAASKVPI